MTIDEIFPERMPTDQRRAWIEWLREAMTEVDDIGFGETHQRPDDYRTGALRVGRAEGGDIYVSIVTTPKDKFPVVDLTFCPMGIGGGHSPSTRQALLLLAASMRVDNRDKPSP